MRILVADDHTLFREGLRYILQDLTADLEILEAEGYDEIFEVAGEGWLPDVILLDLNMPGMDRFSSLKALTTRFPGSAIVIVSASEDRADVRRMLGYGARGFIPKSSSREVMVSALRLVLSGGTYLPPFVLDDEEAVSSNARNHAHTHAPAPGGEAPSPPTGLDNLTPRQQDVLACLAEGKSNKEIARELGLAEGTVKIHIAGILKALKVSNRTQAIITAGRLRDQSN